MAATIINWNPNRKKGAPPVQPGDFFRVRKVQTVEEMAATLNAFAARQNRERSH